MVVGIGRGARVLLTLLGLSMLALWAPNLTLGAEEPPIYLGSFGPEGPGNSNFEAAGTVGVDQETGEVYVLDTEAHTLYKFDAHGVPVPFGGSSPPISGNELSGLTFYPYPSASQVAVDGETHVFYVTADHSLRAFDADGEAAEFTAGPGAGTSELPGFTELYGVAVDANGDIYASDFAGNIKVFESSGALLTEFSAPEAGNVAVSSDGSVYVNRFNKTVLKYTPSEYPVTGATTYTAASEPIAPGETRGVAVDPVTGDVYISQVVGCCRHHILVFDKNGVFIESLGDPGQEGELFHQANGIAVAGATSRVYASTDDDDTPGSTFSQVRIYGPEEVFPGPPSVGALHVSAVDAHSATLHATVNPNTFETSYYFEYGLGDCAISSCTSVPVVGALIGSGHKPVAVEQAVADLQAGLTYHFRVVAQNAEGVTASPDHTFVTQPASLGFELTDNRVWELVSPPNKHGGLLIGTEEGTIQAAADGNGLTYLSVGSIEEDPEGNRAFEASTLLARWDGSRWSSKDITLPNSRVFSVVEGLKTPYKAFTPDLARAVVEPRSDASLSPEASERTPYLRENTDPPLYTPLVTGKEEFANVPSGTAFGGEGLFAILKVRFAGATPDLAHIVLKSEVPLVEGAPESGISLYVWADGLLRPVSVLPEDEGGNIVNAGLIGSGPGTVQNAISEDGERIFWGPGSYGTAGKLTALYMRNTEAEETVRLDVPRVGASGSGEEAPTFQGASSDGTVVYFTDSQQLTEDASPEGRDLYRCEIPTNQAEQGCTTLTDLSAPLLGSGESSKVKRLVSGISNDGSYVYFVAESVLDKSPNGFGDSATQGQANLYRWHEGDGSKFIATLSSEDDPVWGGPLGVTYDLSAASSPSGRYLVFMSNKSLTGFDNRDEISGKPVQEVFRYDAQVESLACVSCNPTGASPRGRLQDPGVRIGDPQGIWGGRWIGAVLPEATIDETANTSFYRPRVVLDNGRVFFNAVDALVPADSNGELDVYQYEPFGIGSCSPSSSGGGVMTSAGGCVGLMSSGTGEDEAAFLDASANGDNVFFLTPAKLSALDEDTVYDIYDARINGVTATRSPQTECSGETCRSASPAPDDSVPTSATFSGRGNQAKKCPRKKRLVSRHGRQRCVTQKHKKHRRKHSRKTSRNRRTHQ